MPPSDRRLAWAAAALGAAPFLLTVPFCGLYLDDYSFLLMLEGISPRQLWTAFIQYVPGRNLHIPFFYALLELTGHSVPAMHLASLAFDALNAALLFLLVARLTGLRSVALAAAAVFAVAPNHGETHFWITLIPQCQIPTTLTLAAFLLASSGSLLPAGVVYAAALFTYDQVFFLWPLLLAVSWSRDAAPRRSRYAAAAAVLLSLNVAHIALRYLSPHASGGRPLIRVADFLHRCRDAAVAVGKGLLPWPTSSHAHWAWSLLAIALSLAAAVWLLRAVRGEARGEKAGVAAWANGTGWLAAALGGAAWTFLAYLPNLFWYLSPRHNLLPSIGWSLAAVALGAYAISRWSRAAAVLPVLACAFFATAAVSNVHEGTQWIDSRRLRDGFSAAVERLSPPVDSAFLVGAPRYLRRAPAFNLPHDVMMAAGRAVGRPGLEHGDYQVSPTRRGVVYRNDLSIGPASAFRWLPAAEANVLSYDPAARSFACAAALAVKVPAGLEHRLALRPNRDCELVLPVEADSFLVASIPGPKASARPDAPRAGPLSLLSAAASAEEGATALDLEWRVEAPPASVVAFLPRIKDASGRVLLDAVFDRRAGRSSYRTIQPLVDDALPGHGLTGGRTLRQRFLLRRAWTEPGPGAVLELEAYEISPSGAAVPLGTVSAVLRRRGN